MPLVVVEAAAFASRFSIRVEERYMFFVAPLLFLALVLWLDRGLPRPRLLTVAVAVVAPLLFLALPLGTLLNVSIYSDTLGLIPFLRLAHFVHGALWTHRLLVAGGVAAGALFVLWPRRWLPSLVLPGAVAVFLVLSTYAVTGALRDYSRSVRGLAGSGASASWVDRALAPGSEAGFLLGTTGDPWPEAQSLWQQEFWNRQIGPTYNLGIFEPAGGVEIPVAISSQNGEVVDQTTGKPLRSPYMISSLSYRLDGRIVAFHPPFALFRTRGPVRVAAATTGIYGDRWMGADAGYSRYAKSPPGRLVVRLSRELWTGPDVPGHVAITLRRAGSTRPLRTVRWTVHSGSKRTFVLATPRGRFAVAVHISPTFSPSQFGRPDTRQLGAQVSFVFVPSR